MQIMSWKYLILIAIALCSLAAAVPVPQELSLDAPNPVALDDGTQSEVDREKRKIFGPDVGFGVKNAILGYVFGKIDGILDAKTKLINQFDAANVAKNKAAGIEPPVPINSLQQLLQAVISPKIAAITSKFGALSGTSAGGLGSLSGGSGGFGSSGIPVGTDDDSDSNETADLNEAGVPIASAGSGNIVTSFLKLSGPILSSSSGSAKSVGVGVGVPVPVGDDDEE